MPFVPGMGPGLSLGRLSRKGRQKNVYVFCVYRFFAPKLKSTQITGTPKAEFFGSQRRGDKGVIREGTGPEEETERKNEGKGREERGPEDHSKNSGFGTLMI